MRKDSPVFSTVVTSHIPQTVRWCENRAPRVPCSPPVHFWLCCPECWAGTSLPLAEAEAVSDSSELKWALPLNKVSFSLFSANLLASQPWLPKITQCISGTRSCQLSVGEAKMMSDWWLNHAFLSECIRILPNFLHFYLIRITLAILSALSSTSEGTEEGGRVIKCCKKKSDHVSALSSQARFSLRFARRRTKCASSADDMHEGLLNYDHERR